MQNIKQNTAAVLSKTKNLMGIASEILSSKTPVTEEVVEEWVKVLWAWADENNVPDLVWVEDKPFQNGGFWEGMPRNQELLLSLTELRLHNKKLTKVPKEIGNLTKLTLLRLDRNKLIDLPEEIGHLTNLVVLRVEYNKIKKLPKEIGNLINLTQFTLKDNKLKELPKELGKLKSLKLLMVADNFLSSLPQEIVNLTNLTFLSLNDNNELLSSFTQEQDDWIDELQKNNCELQLLDRPGF